LRVVVSHPFRSGSRSRFFDSAALRSEGWGTRSCVNTQLENAVKLHLCFLQVLDRRRRPGPEGPVNSLSFRGLKPPAPSQNRNLTPLVRSEKPQLDAPARSETRNLKPLAPFEIRDLKTAVSRKSGGAAMVLDHLDCEMQVKICKVFSWLKNPSRNTARAAR